MTNSQPTLEIHGTKESGYSEVLGVAEETLEHILAVTRIYLRGLGIKAVVRADGGNTLKIEPPVPSEDVRGLARQLSKTGLGSVDIYSHDAERQNYEVTTETAKADFALMPGYVDTDFATDPAGGN